MKKTIRALLLVLVMCLISLTGCGKDSERKGLWLTSEEKINSTEETETETQTEASTEVEETEDDSDTLVIGINGTTSCLSPFFKSSSIYDKQVDDLISIPLIEADRERQFVYMGKTGETRNYNGTDYTYYGISDMTVSQNDDGTTDYNFDLRDDIYFSDGEKLTADDAVFSLYVYLDPSYEGTFSYLKTCKIKGLSEYLNDESVTSIEGIKKTGDFSFCITTTVNYTNPFFEFKIAPLHYYGEINKYDYDNGKFGFDKGDLTVIHKKDNKPLGAGPYAFVEENDGTIMLCANEYYYKGAPKCKKLKVICERDGFYLDQLYDGIIDITSISYSQEERESLKVANSNNDITGDKATTFVEDNMGYGYISIRANRVMVGDNPGSDESKNLRKAFMTLFSVYREESVNEYYDDTAHVINYPVSDSSWAAPKKEEAGYEIAYSKDVDNNKIYDENTPQEDKVAAAKEAALGFFEAAGYIVENGKVVSAPEGASTEYKIWIYAGGKGYHPLYNDILNTQKDLAEMGISLEIVDCDVTGADVWTSVDKGEVDMWCGAWNNVFDPNLRDNYYSGVSPEDEEYRVNNLLAISDEELDRLIIESQNSSDRDYLRSVYKKSFDIVMDWGVELPTYQRMKALIISTERVKLDTLPSDMNPYYEWTREIQNVEINK